MRFTSEYGAVKGRASKLVEKFHKSLRQILRTFLEAKNRSEFRKWSDERQLCSSFYMIDAKEEMQESA